MRVTVMTPDDRMVAVDVDPNEQVENVKAILEVETLLPIAKQQLIYNGISLQDHLTLSAAGVHEDDLLVLTHIPSGSGRHHGEPVRAQGDRGGQELAMLPDGSAANPVALQRQLRADRHLMERMMQANRHFADIIMGDNIEAFQDALRIQHQARAEAEHQQQEDMDLLSADPFDIDAQRRIEERIRKKNVEENWENALEYNPEAFAQVVMLYVDVEVNGVPLKAFVDSGAQTTIMSKDCAERTGLLRLMDSRYSGVARGVGTGRILGRIHVAQLKVSIGFGEVKEIGSQFYPCSFTVLEAQDMELLFGLDMLRKHQCLIDLKNGCLQVGGGEVSVPFLAEKDLPSRLRMHPDIQDAESMRGNATSSASGLPSTLGQLADVRQPPVAPSDGSQGMEEKVVRLSELGFDRAQVLEALALCRGNEEQAASLLFGG
eukprot:SM000045S16254  [mRNA]  locus=s45:582830:586859:+ [translate_table: standard]